MVPPSVGIDGQKSPGQPKLSKGLEFEDQMQYTGLWLHRDTISRKKIHKTLCKAQTPMANREQSQSRIANEK